MFMYLMFWRHGKEYSQIPSVNVVPWNHTFLTVHVNVVIGLDLENLNFLTGIFFHGKLHLSSLRNVVSLDFV